MQPLVPYEVVVPTEVLDDVWSSLSDGLRCLEESTLETTSRVLDTFDWRLWSAGLRLDVARDGDGWHALLLSSAGDLVQRQDLDRPLLGFAESIPDGALRERLVDRIEPRRLLPWVEMRLRTTRMRVVDAEEKTVVRIERIEPAASAIAFGTEALGEPLVLSPRLRLRPVRGYDDAFAAVRRHVGDLRLTPPTHLLIDEALHAAGHAPGEYQGKPKLEFKASEPAAEATRRIHRQLLDVLRVNEDGTRRDLDSEFLHDLRVSVRRTRSALTQIKGVFPPDHLEHFKNEMRWLGGVTGPTRDLDVYLLKMPAYRASLPDAIADDLEPLQRFLVAHQKSEQKKLARTLRSARYRKLLADWQRFLDEPPDVSSAMAPNAERPIREIASQRIWKSYRRVVKRGGRIDDSSPDDALHDLRKDCKKLRYLLEFFAALYPRGEIKAAVKALKRLQDVLGDFNDYSVQQESLRDFAEQMTSEETAAEHEAPVDTLLAMGHLLAHLADGQAAERRRFAERFRGFVAAENQDRFRRLFG
ncbi:MAG: CHAD domain-containing protein [Acidobacteriota bacterium]